MKTDQMMLLTSKEFAGHVAFWKQQLSHLDDEFIFHGVRAQNHDFIASRDSVDFCLSDKATNNLRALANDQDLGIFIVLLSGLLVAISRFADRRAVSVRTPLLGNDQFEGQYAKDALLIEDTDDDLTIKELLVRAQRTVSLSYKFQDFPLEHIADKTGSVTRTNVFVCFPKIHNRCESLESYDFIVEINDTGLSVSMKALYNTALFDGDCVRSILECTQNAIESFRFLDRKLKDLDLLSEGDRQRFVSEFNDTSSEYPDCKTIHELFEAQVEKAPDQIALGFDGKDMTYRELNDSANRLATHLQKAHEIGPDDLVGLMVSRSAKSIIGLLGILKSGAAYVPIDPHYPKERIDHVIKDANLKTILADAQFASEAGALKDSVVNIAAFTDSVLEAEQRPANLATSQELAYVIYTSGSTGRPKGAQVTHRAVINLLWSMSERLRLSVGDVWLAVSSLSFDIAALELFLPLIAGARLEIANQSEVSDGPKLIEKLAGCRATILQATPATWRMLLDCGWHADRRIQILCGGDAMPAKLASGLAEQNAAAVWNLYGPTETTIWSMAHKLDGNSATVSLGAPLANTQVYLLDKYLKPVMAGLSGELYIGGDGLSRGYLNKPDLTAEVFIPNPFSKEPGARLYKTGDMARRLSSGEIEFLQRIDHQVKIRGYRIELGEIETTLEQHPGIRQAVAMAREDEPGEKRLVAYVEGDQEQLRNTEHLREFLGERLPDYMLPSVFVVMESIPLTPNGKIDRKSLPPPGYTRPGLRDDYAAPGTSIEELLAAIWADVLSIEQPGIHDNFFALGGESILGTQIMLRVQALFQVELPLRELFARPTIASLAQWIEANGSPDSHDMARIAQILETLDEIPSEESNRIAE